MQLTAQTAVPTGAPPGGDTELDPLALADGERVRGRAAGIIGSDTAMLVVTDRRVLVIREDDHQSSIVLPLSEVRMARWEPAAECHEDDSDRQGQPDSESGARWGSVRLNGAKDSVRLSLVVARDGERCVALIRTAIGLPPTDKPRNRGRQGQPNRRAAVARLNQASRPRGFSTASPARGPDPTDLSTAVITPEFDTVVTQGPLPTEELDPAASRDGDPGSDSGGSGPGSDEAAPSTVTATKSPDREAGRHRIAVKSGPTRHTTDRDKTNKRFRLAGAIAVGLGVVTIIGLQAGNKPLSGLFGCTHAGDADAVVQALASAGPGDEICVTSDLPSLRLNITRGGDIDNPVTVTGKGLTLVGGITVHADNVVVSGFQILRDPKQAIQIRGNGINVENNTGASGKLTPAWG